MHRGISPMNSAVLMELALNDLLVWPVPRPWVQSPESDRLVVHQVHNDSMVRFLWIDIRFET